MAAKKTPLTADEVRAMIGDAKKEVESDRIVVSRMVGSVSAIVALLDDTAALAEIDGAYRVEWRNETHRRYRHGRYIGTYGAAGFVVVGEREYTDEELEAGGRTLVANIERKRATVQKNRDKKLAKLNELARSLGVEVVS